MQGSDLLLQEIALIMHLGYSDQQLYPPAAVLGDLCLNEPMTDDTLGENVSLEPISMDQAIRNAFEQEQNPPSSFCVFIDQPSSNFHNSSGNDSSEYAYPRVMEPQTSLDFCNLLTNMASLS